MSVAGPFRVRAAAWHESAIALESPELAEAFRDNIEEEVLLTNPSTT